MFFTAVVMIHLRGNRHRRDPPQLCAERSAQ